MLKKAAKLSLLAGASLQNQICEHHSLYPEQGIRHCKSQMELPVQH